MERDNGHQQAPAACMWSRQVCVLLLPPFTPHIPCTQVPSRTSFPRVQSPTAQAAAQSGQQTKQQVRLCFHTSSPLDAASAVSTAVLVGSSAVCLTAAERAAVGQLQRRNIGSSLKLCCAVLCCAVLCCVLCLLPGGGEGSSGGSSGSGGEGPPTNLNNNLMLGLTLMGALLMYQVGGLSGGVCGGWGGVRSWHWFGVEPVCGMLRGAGVSTICWTWCVHPAAAHIRTPMHCLCVSVSTAVLPPPNRHFPPTALVPRRSASRSFRTSCWQGDWSGGWRWSTETWSGV
jgi:hypothetical protein